MLSWCKKVAGCRLQVAVIFLLTACGFQPMYGEHSAFSTTPLAGNLAIDAIGGRDGQIFKIKLEDLLNPERKPIANPQYHLQVKLVKALIPSVIKSDGTVQRYDIQITSTFTLLENAKPVFTGNVQRNGSYNVATNANFATYEAGQDVTERTLKELAEDYMLRLSGYFAIVNKPAKP